MPHQTIDFEDCDMLQEAEMGTERRAASPFTSRIAAPYRVRIVRVFDDVPYDSEMARSRDKVNMSRGNDSGATRFVTVVQAPARAKDKIGGSWKDSKVNSQIMISGSRVANDWESTRSSSEVERFSSASSTLSGGTAEDTGDEGSLDSASHRCVTSIVVRRCIRG